VIRHFDVFILMEEEIKSISIPFRPKTPQDITKAKLEKQYRDDVGNEKHKEMIKAMQTIKKGGLSNNPYINMKICVDWCSIPSLTRPDTY
jgi:hypothetical protein